MGFNKYANDKEVGIMKDKYGNTLKKGDWVEGIFDIRMKYIQCISCDCRMKYIGKVRGPEGGNLQKYIDVKCLNEKGLPTWFLPKELRKLSDEEAMIYILEENEL